MTYGLGRASCLHRHGSGGPRGHLLPAGRQRTRNPALPMAPAALFPSPARPRSPRCGRPAMPHWRAGPQDPADRLSNSCTHFHFAERLSDRVDGVEVILSDIWGVVHNGLESFPEACAALHTYRQRGGTVILITNAPRPADSVQRPLRKLRVADQ